MDEPIDCARIHRELRARGAAGVNESAAMRAHLDDCPACRELVQHAELADMLAAADDDFELDEPQLDAMLGQLEQQIDAHRGPFEWLRQRPTSVRAVILAVLSFGLVALVAINLGRIDLPVYPLPRLLLTCALLIAVIFAAGAAFLRPLHRPSFTTRVLAAITALALAAPTALCSLPAAHHDHPISLLGTGEHFVDYALGCFVFGLVLAIVPIGAAYLLDRGALRRRGDLFLAFLGAGAVSNLLLVLHCPFVAPAHKLAGHASVSFALGLIALLFWLLGRFRNHSPD